MGSTGGDPADDSALVAGLQAGDRAAFERLVRDHGARLLAVARRMVRDEATAQDCLQDAFLSVHRGIARFEPHGSFSGWLHRITGNACLMRLRSAKRLAETPIDDLLPAFDADGVRMGEPRTALRDPENELEAARIRRFMRQKIDELPEGYRIVLLLRDIEGYSTREAAEMVGIAEGALKVRLHRARAALKTLVEPLWNELERS
ncbi:sigma-70 family RNA polymerase sigma factor [Thalassobaculum sp. OXR-137]|uniref:RNA polymerase sigma factor n=1 Tax=Thalassobaculum sp. OXR-137 TaxID=3100173 RepID=UPI002AC9EFF7|nr:sigma-70 family RNA polymerase sigma factor [Thalassobaculum sp. OXR-137]WPZ33820.1 sigma-70 family RNA polymerase sigma factor [Thalassobaculum sp. OXR-137]